MPHSGLHSCVKYEEHMQQAWIQIYLDNSGFKPVLSGSVSFKTSLPMYLPEKKGMTFYSHSIRSSQERHRALMRKLHSDDVSLQRFADWLLFRFELSSAGKNQSDALQQSHVISELCPARAGEERSAR